MTLPLTAFVDHYLAQVPERLQRWLGPELRRRIEAILDEEFGNRSLEFGEMVMAPDLFPGTGPSDYAYQLIEFEPGCRALCSIRLRGGDVQWPFVEVVALDVELDDAGAESLLAAVEGRYAAFRPRGLRVLAAELEPRRTTSGLWVYPDQCFWAAPWSRIAKRDGLALPPRAELVELRPAVVYDDYVRAYSNQAFERPTARAESLERLEEFADEGRLRSLMVEGAWAGLAAAELEDEAHLHGLEITEIIIRPGMRGRGLGPAMMRAFLATQGLEPSTLVYGEIDWRNEAAAKTAQRVGREALGGYTFVSREPDTSTGTSRP